MKRICLLFILIVCLGNVIKSEVPAGRFVLEGSVGYFQPASNTLKDIYSNRIFLEFAAEYVIDSKLSVWGSAALYSGNGELTFTKDKTEISIVPLIAGIKYKLPFIVKGMYVGAGAGFFSFREKNFLGTATSFSPGVQVKAGVMLPLSGVLGLDIQGRYDFCTTEPEDIKVKVGGFKTSAGLFVHL